MGMGLTLKRMALLDLFIIWILAMAFFLSESESRVVVDLVCSVFSLNFTSLGGLRVTYLVQSSPAPCILFSIIMGTSNFH